VIKEALRWFRSLGSIRAVAGELNKAEFRNRHNRPFQDYSVWRILQVHGELRQKRLPGEPRQRRIPTNPKGNAKIGEVAENGVEAALKQKIRDAERAKPFILHLVQHQGCDSYGKLADALNFHGVPTPRSGSWYPTSVKNCLAALGFRLTELVNLECCTRPLPDTDQQLSHGPQRPSRGERQQIRERYGLPSNPRGKVQKLLPDIIALRDQEAGVGPIARILGISEISVKAVIKRYPATLGRSAEQKMTDKVVKAYATGQQPTEIAKALGISVPGVKHRLRQAQKPLERTPRKVAAPPWLKAVQKRRSVELGDGVTADKGVPPEVIVALDALLAERPKSGVKPLARDKILDIVALTGQEVARDQIASRLGIGKSTVYRVLDQLRQFMP
jgi:transposase-like protein